METLMQFSVNYGHIVEPIAIGALFAMAAVALVIGCTGKKRDSLGRRVY